MLISRVTSRITGIEYKVLSEEEPTLDGQRVLLVQSLSQEDVVFPAPAIQFKEFSDG